MDQQTDRLVDALLSDTLPPGLAQLDRSMTKQQAVALKQQKPIPSDTPPKKDKGKAKAERRLLVPSFLPLLPLLLPHCEASAGLDYSSPHSAQSLTGTGTGTGTGSGSGICSNRQLQLVCHAYWYGS